MWTCVRMDQGVNPRCKMMGSCWCGVTAAQLLRVSPALTLSLILDPGLSSCMGLSVAGYSPAPSRTPHVSHITCNSPAFTLSLTLDPGLSSCMGMSIAGSSAFFLPSSSYLHLLVALSTSRPRPSPSLSLTLEPGLSNCMGMRVAGSPS